MEGGLIRPGCSRLHLSSNIARIVLGWRARPEVITRPELVFGELWAGECRSRPDLFEARFRIVSGLRTIHEVV